MPKTILITGAGSGFGTAAALGIAKAEHAVIATAQISPQVAALRDEIAELQLKNITMLPTHRSWTSMFSGIMPAWARRGLLARFR
jgi:NADP-dependent 3-hydroxy acid dehydrogenase YdfG